MTRTVVVTGAGSGIGAAIAATLAQRDWRVVVTDLDLEAARRVAAGRLDQDHVRAHVSEELAGPGPEVARKLDHHDAVERSAFALGGRCRSCGTHSTPSSCKAASSALSMPSSSLNTSSVCSPTQGPPRRISQSVFERWTGRPGRWQRYITLQRRQGSSKSSCCSDT